MTEIVWIVECGSYDQAYISGVYATLEAAQAAHLPPENYRYPAVATAADMSAPGGWRAAGPKADPESVWSDGIDWDGCTITRFEVEQ